MVAGARPVSPGRLMPNTKKIVMPLAAALAFALALWLAFHDRSSDPVPASPSVKSSQAEPLVQVAVNRDERPRTRARSADPASSRS